MKTWLRAFLSYSSLERKGIILLIMLIFIIISLNLLINYNPPHYAAVKDTLLLKDLQAFERQLADADDSVTDSPPSLWVENTEYEAFIFDPNAATAGDLRRLGMSDRLIKTIIRYRLHGGRFYNKEDLKKIYGMGDPFYNRLEPYIVIENHRVLKVSYKSNVTLERVFMPVDINRADSLALIRLRGIGPVLSSRILRYRRLLGGFYDTEQLKEVFGLPDSIISEMRVRFYADTSAIVKINLNIASEKDMARHPYIGKYIAKGIVRYRSEVLRIKCVDELKSNGLISSEKLKRLKKYVII
jgi:competence protein ComEA